ncbi:MAG: hypothetical protein GWP08_09970 [Nitrospiraceae bacterium]|nr:hypothetical protein [Nitrospiraceae bacterium]
MQPRPSDAWTRSSQLPPAPYLCPNNAGERRDSRASPAEARQSRRPSLFLWGAGADTLPDVPRDTPRHPDIHLSYGKVVVEIRTHKVDGLTEGDTDGVPRGAVGSGCADHDNGGE